ncbi:short chain dehydrogenase [Aspergillus novofumigatus IBT 16806]|uniref:Short chain dehydrogenase n=1 Tax=Aspergillus novofumigatus (strain IBT 16806) TaxID=1392255 RepID=A0A2I1BU73_ASPN1|nr:short chain dehydrogenase [Aspergillus novofumigatus IBT 16806]PKX88902.1 short chain dehydrogenase [Aspergillus novofumigatus IBT 16806]
MSDPSTGIPTSAATHHFPGIKDIEVIATLLPHEEDEHLISKGVHVTRTDVTKDESVEELEKTVQQLTGGKLDILINNAGICYTMPATDTEVTEVEKMFKVNVFGPMRMVHYMHRFVIEAKGVVVNIGSIGGVCPYVYGASYNASKAALHHYGNTLRVEMRPFGVRVVNIISGEVHTNILKNDHGRALPEDSVYYPMNDAFQAHLYRKPDGITPDQYAAGVVKEILKKSPAPWFWFGASSGLIRCIDAFLPRTFWDWFFGRLFNLGKLADLQSGGVKLT